MNWVPSISLDSLITDSANILGPCTHKWELIWKASECNKKFINWAPPKHLCSSHWGQDYRKTNWSINHLLHIPIWGLESFARRRGFRKGKYPRAASWSSCVPNRYYHHNILSWIKTGVKVSSVVESVVIVNLSGSSEEQGTTRVVGEVTWTKKASEFKRQVAWSNVIHVEDSILHLSTPTNSYLSTTSQTEHPKHVELIWSVTHCA